MELRQGEHIVFHGHPSWRAILSFYIKGLDGRIDDANAGWKGRGLWTSSGDRAPWLIEGGKGMKPMAVHFQLRPDPLAK